MTSRARRPVARRVAGTALAGTAFTGLAIALLAATSLGGAPTAQAAPPPPPDQRWGPAIVMDPVPALARHPASVAIVGDSLAVDAWLGGQLPARVSALGWTVSGLYAQGGVLLPEMIDRLGPIVGDLPPTVVVVLGTNDLSWGADPATFGSDVRRMLRLLGPDRRVAWLTLYTGCGPPCTARQQEFNAVLARLDARWRRLVVADWAGAVTADPTLLRSDDPWSTHPSETGSAVIADLMAWSAVRAMVTYPTRPTGPRRQR